MMLLFHSWACIAVTISDKQFFKILVKLVKLHCQINHLFSGIPQILCWTECLVKFCISILVIASRLVELYKMYFKQPKFSKKIKNKKKENRNKISNNCHIFPQRHSHIYSYFSFLFFFRLQWPVRSFPKKFHSDWHVCLSMLWRLALWSFQLIYKLCFSLTHFRPILFFTPHIPSKLQETSIFGMFSDR